MNRSAERAHSTRRGFTSWKKEKRQFAAGGHRRILTDQKKTPKFARIKGPEPVVKVGSFFPGLSIFSRLNLFLKLRRNLLWKLV